MKSRPDGLTNAIGLCCPKIKTPMHYWSYHGYPENCKNLHVISLCL